MMLEPATETVLDVLAATAADYERLYGTSDHIPAGLKVTIDALAWLFACAIATDSPVYFGRHPDGGVHFTVHADELVTPDGCLQGDASQEMLKIIVFAALEAGLSIAIPEPPM